MENPRPEKVATVSEITDLFGGSDAALLTEYRGMSVKHLSELRRSLRAVGAEYKVYKNTLVWKAALASGRDTDDLEKLLHGPTAIAFVKGDAVEAAKALRDFAKTNPNLIVKGGLLGTKVLTGPETAALADMPPRIQVLAEIAGLFEAPLSTLASLLEAPARDIAYAIAALIEKNGGDEAVAA
jgi:large subunit ribosomal protein L10